MFIRKKKNKSGSVSVQIISKHSGKYKVIKTLGSGWTPQEIEFLYQQARQEISQVRSNLSLFGDANDTLIESYLTSIKNAQVQVIGPELIFGKEIIWTNHAGYLNIYKNNGATLPGLPVKPEGSTQSAIDPVIGDINGDSDLEIFVDNNRAFSDSSHYHVYHHTGEEVSWSPLVIPGGVSFNCPALGDIENDGSIEMFFMQFDPYGWDTYLWCYSIPEVPYSADRFPWAMHGHDPQHTFWYDHKYQPENYINNNNQFPDHFRIFPNYPNPFNPSTTISFELPKETYTEINIYNLAGQLVQTLVNELKPAGRHQIIWNAGNLPPGIYFYQIKVKDHAGSGVQTKKCILLK